MSVWNLLVNCQFWSDWFFCVEWLIGATAVGGASFGQGSHRIWLVDVQCVGSERRLEHCPAVRNGVNSCTHAQDAGVRCPSSG